MERFTNKQLAIGVWGIAGFNFILSTVVTFLVSHTIAALSLVTGLLSMVILVALGYAIYRDKNDKTTFIIMIVFGVLSLNLSIAVLFIMVLLRRGTIKTKNLQQTREKIRRLWYLPVIISGIGIIISFIFTMSSAPASSVPAYNILGTIVPGILTTIFILILSHWMIVRLGDVNKNDETAAYYKDLLERNVITQDEYDQKTAELEGGK